MIRMKQCSLAQLRWVEEYKLVMRQCIFFLRDIPPKYSMRKKNMLVWPRLCVYLCVFVFLYSLAYDDSENVCEFVCEYAYIRGWPVLCGGGCMASRAGVCVCKKARNPKKRAAYTHKHRLLKIIIIMIKIILKICLHFCWRDNRQTGSTVSLSPHCLWGNWIVHSGVNFIVTSSQICNLILQLEMPERDISLGLACVSMWA